MKLLTYDCILTFVIITRSATYCAANCPSDGVPEIASVASLKTSGFLEKHFLHSFISHCVQNEDEET